MSQHDTQLRSALELCVSALEHFGISGSTRTAALEAARAALSATQPAQAAQGEPSYFRREIGECSDWQRCTHEQYLAAQDDPHIDTRVDERGSDVDGVALMQEIGHWRAQVQSLQAQLEQSANTLGYATRLASAIWERYWKNDAPNWASCDNLLGVLSQIDNMTSGMVRKQPAVAQGAGQVVASEFFAYHPDMGVEFFKTQREAVACTSANLDYERESAIDHGEWDDSAAERTCWGVVVQRAKVVQSGVSDDGVAQFDYVLSNTQPAAGADVLDAKRWRYAMDWDTKDFAVCRRVGATGTCWEPIKTDGPIDAAIAASGRQE